MTNTIQFINSLKEYKLKYLRAAAIIWFTFALSVIFTIKSAELPFSGGALISLFLSILADLIELPFVLVTLYLATVHIIEWVLNDEHSA